jgi:hypothetical protein
MPASESAGLVNTPPLELAARTALACGAAIWLAMRAGPLLLELLIPYLETVVHWLDTRYRIEFTLTHSAGRGGMVSDLSLLGRATVTRLFFIPTPTAPIVMQSGTVLTSATAVGVLLQPAAAIIALLLGYPANCLRALLVRMALGIMMIGLWFLAGLPFSLWLYLHDLPTNAFAPSENTLATPIGKFLLNGGSVALGLVLGAAAVAGGAALSARLRAPA